MKNFLLGAGKSGQLVVQDGGALTSEMVLTYQLIYQLQETNDFPMPQMVES